MAQLVNISKTLQLKNDATVNEFSTWTIRYKALATQHKFKDIMIGNDTKPVAVDPANPTQNETKEVEDFMRRNNDGYSHLLLSVTKEKDIQAIAESTSLQFPEGSLKTAWEKLNRNYKPKTGRSKNELIQIFYGTYLNKMNYPPELWFSGMERIRKDLQNLHSYAISDIDYAEHVLANSRHEYESTLEKYRVGLKGTIPTIVVQDMIDDLQEQYELYWKRKGRDPEAVQKKFKFEDKFLQTKGEIGLAVRGKYKPTKKFKGKCTLCGQQGHKASKCWEDPKNADKRPANWTSRLKNDEDIGDNAQDKNKCNLCGKEGHKMENCFYNPFNPNNKLKSTELSNSCIPCDDEDSDDESEDEVGLATLSVPIKMEPSKPEEETNFKVTSKVSKEEINLHFKDMTEKEIRETVWIADSGASTYMYTQDKGFGNSQANRSGVQVGEGTTCVAPKIGNWHGTAKCGKTNKVLKIKLGKTLLVPDLHYNLFSLLQSMTNGAQFYSVKGFIRVVLPKNGGFINFKHRIVTKNGFVIAGILKPAEPKQHHDKMNPEHALPAQQLTTSGNNSFKRCHQIFCHTNDNNTRATAQKLGIKAKGTAKNCIDCKMAKARQKAINKNRQVTFEPIEDKTKYKPLEKIAIDISSAKTISCNNNKYWNLTVDYKTNHKWSMFLKRRKHLSKRMLTFIKDEIKTKLKKNISTVRCDNAGENKVLDQLCQEGSLGINFEYAARKTPQQNSTVERAFATLWGMIRATLRSCGLDKRQRLKNRLWAEAANMVTQVMGIIVSNPNEKCTHEQVYNRLPVWCIPKKLRAFGEICVVTDKTKLMGKLANRGAIGIMVGYCNQHAAGTYRIFLLESETVIETRDVQWTNQYFGDWYSAENDPHHDSSDDDDQPNSDDEDSILYTSNRHNNDVDGGLTNNNENENVNVNEENNEDNEDNNEDDEESSFSSNDDENEFYNKPARKAEHSTRTTRTSAKAREQIETETPRTDKLIAELKRLNTSYNPTLDNKQLDICFAGTDFGLHSAINSDYAEPGSYKQMLKLPKEEREKWLDGCKEEFNNMNKKKVWVLTPTSKIPKGRKIIRCKWVFKKKRCGRYRSRLVAMGFTQIPGVDFTDSFAPVVSDVTMRILVVLWILFGWDTQVVDVEGAFLYGILDKPIYMNMPEGLNGPKGHCVKLLRSIYGLVNSGRIWWQTFTNHLKKKNFKVSKADQCLFVRKDKNGICIFILYVDDAFFLGDTVAIESAIIDIREAFVITTQGTLEDYLGCKFTLIPEEKTAYITQPYLIEKLIKKFEKELTNRKYKTPGTPGFTTSLKSVNETNVMSEEKMERYRSGVGMLLYLVKHSRPDLSNPTRELSKCLTKAKEKYYDELLRIISFLRQTKEHGLKLKTLGLTFLLNDPLLSQPKVISWYLRAFCDASYASDPDRRLSVTGFLIYFCGALISWKSKLQKSPTISSTECEYVAISDVVREIMYIRNILKSLGINVGLPVIVEVDNLGAIYLANNANSSVRTKHVDVHYHFVRDYCERGITLVRFVSGAFQRSDIMTKNTSSTIYEKHTPNFIGKPPV